MNLGSRGECDNHWTTGVDIVALSGKALGYGLDGRSSFTDGCRFFHYFVTRQVLGSTQPPVQMSTGVMKVKRRVSHSTSSWRLGCEYVPLGLHGL